MRANALLAALLLLVPTAAGQQYQKPPQAILEVLDAPDPPTPFLSPTCDRMVLAQPLDYPSIGDLAESILKLAGVRINPRTNNERGYLFYWTKLAVKDLVAGERQRSACRRR